MFLMMKMTQVLETVATYVPFLEKFIQPYYRPIVQNEIKLADIQATDHILCIGGGPLPVTAIMLHKKTKAHVTMIDCSLKACLKAKKYIKKNNFNAFITVEHGCGLSKDLSLFNVVHVAKQVSPKSKVIDYLLAHSKEHTKIIVRYNQKESCLCPLKSVCQKRRWVKNSCLFLK